MVVIECAAVLWSIFGAANFGAANSVTNYQLTHFSESSPSPPIAMQFAVWFIGGGLLSVICSLLIIFCRQRRCSTSVIFTRMDTHFDNRGTRNRAIMHCIVSSVAYVVGLVLFRLCFKISKYEQNIGPLSVVVVIDLIIAAVLCHTWLQERMTIVQWLTVLTVFAGIIFLSIADAAAVSGFFWSGFPWALSASCLFLVSNMGIKHAFDHDMGAASLHLLRMTVVMCCGIICFVVSACVDDDPFLSDLFAWGLMGASGFFYGAGVLCLNYALQYECTGVSLAIITGCNSIIVSVAAHNATMPWTVIRIVGMSLLGFAMASMVLLMCIQWCCTSEAYDDDAHDLGDA